VRSARDSSNPKTDIYYIEVLGKTLDILDAFVRSEKPLLSLQELSIETGLNKNTVFRILYTLAEHGYVSKENHLYQLGQKTADLGKARLHGQNLVTVAGPYLTSLRDEFGETVNLGVLSGGSVSYVDVRECHERFRLAERIGGTDPLHSTALGKAQLAFLPRDEIRSLMKQCGMKKYTDYTITSISALQSELKQIRGTGYAVDNQESMIGAFCVAAPILNTAQQPVGAISIAGPLLRFDHSQVPQVSSALRKAAREIQRKLGY
jgi:DNA-binding IclR family transcriptional regulator